MNAQEIARERNRRLSIAKVLLGITEGEFEPDYTYNEDLDPNNLPGRQEQLEKYRKIALIPPQPTAVITKHQSSAKAPGGEMRDMEDILRMMVRNNEERDRERKTISQKGAADMLKSVPSVAPNDTVLTGAKLLSWFETLVSTYLDDYFWTGGQNSLNQTAKLFEKAPALLAVWENYVHSDDEVRRLRAMGKHREAWIKVAGGIMAANHGDCHAHQRKATRSYMHTLHQSGEKTVQELITAHHEESQARQVLGIYDGMNTLLHHVKEDARACRLGANRGVTMLGLDISDRHGEHLQLHQKFVKLLAEWANRQSMYGLYGGLKPDIQTHLEDGMQMAESHRLMPKVGEQVATFEEVATMAIQHEARSRNRTKDTARLLHQLGFPVKKVPKTKAIAKQTAGNQLSDSDEESQHSSDEDDTGTAENGANTGWYEEGTTENGWYEEGTTESSWYEEGTTENGWYEEGTAENGANTGWYEEGTAGDEPSHKPSANGKTSPDGSAPFNLNALLETVAKFTAAGSSADGVEKVKKIYKQSAERNASRRD